MTVFTLTVNGSCLLSLTLFNALTSENTYFMKHDCLKHTALCLLLANNIIQLKTYLCSINGTYLNTCTRKCTWHVPCILCQT